MDKVIGVIGLGRFGSSVAKTLFKLGQKVLAIDQNQDNIEALHNQVNWARHVAYSVDSFRECGLADCATVIVAIGHSIKESVTVTMMLKEMNIRTVIARSINPLHAKILEKIGADKVLNPEEAMGIRVANQLLYSDILELIEISPEYSVHQINATEEMIGKALADLNLRKKYETVVIAIKREERLIIIPEAKERIMPDDKLIVILRTVNLKKLLKNSD